MPTFTDIYLIQTIGLLKTRKFSGNCHLHLNFKAESAYLQFTEGVLVNAHCGTQVGEAALQAMIWCDRGDMEYVQNPFTADTHAPMELTIEFFGAAARMPTQCPALEGLLLERVKQGSAQELSLPPTAQNIYDAIRNNGIEVRQAIGTFSPEIFWQNLFYLMGMGRVVIHYGRTLSVLLLKLQEGTVAQLQKNLGKRAADLYYDHLAQEMDAQWPNVKKHKSYDRVYGLHDLIYGTGPYRTWARLLHSTLSKVTSPALGNTSYKKAVAALTPPEQALLQQLLTDG